MQYDLTEERAKLLGSLLLFTMTFYKIRTGREFVLSEPLSRESHFITICRELTNVFYLETNRLLINVPPGHGKSELMIHFIAWCMAHYPDCQFLYISYSHELAAKHTATIKSIMELPHYRKLFGIEISRESSAKDNFKTTAGGAVKAFGSAGAITGQDAGLPNQDRFSGAVIMDDMHKPDEVHSDTIRETVKRNYMETVLQRPRGPQVPILGIGQRLHADDLFGNLITGFDGYEWRKIILKAIDEAGNALYPNVNPIEMLRIKQKTDPYVFASQFQQDPIPAGGAIYKPEYFRVLEIEDEPEIIATFITADTAETDKTYNDATVFSFWGVYKIKILNADTDLYALHWLNCVELWCEPKDLKRNFLEFYADCLRYPVKPMVAAIEKKSTGVTLISVLDDMQGLNIINIERTKASGNKTARFLEAQPYAASKRITLPYNGRHNQLVIKHMEKITANDTHLRDDIADTFYDAVKIELIDGIVTRGTLHNEKHNQIARLIARNSAQINNLKRRAYANS
jgi:predicted phage terminase large subunit-like protein